MVLPGLYMLGVFDGKNLHLNPANITIRPVLSMLPRRLRIYLSRMAVVFRSVGGVSLIRECLLTG